VKKIDLSRQLARKKQKRIAKTILIIILGAMLGSLLINVAIRLPLNASKPVNAILVLGGSIQREIYTAKLTKDYPDVPIIISHGSDDPCILSIFQAQNARLNNVWLEHCAHNTFDNFFFNIPTLRRWGAHKVKVVTSGSHLKRATWMGKILLGANGIAVEVDSVKERGRPGNRESQLKTTLDLSRSILWAFFSQFIQPPCFDRIELNKVDLEHWNKRGFECEYQGRIKKN
jgi:uncharacterized SAM-binding protein YcdF (DUF218 family)